MTEGGVVVVGLNGPGIASRISGRTGTKAGHRDDKLVRDRNHKEKSNGERKKINKAGGFKWRVWSQLIILLSVGKCENGQI